MKQPYALLLMLVVLSKTVGLAQTEEALPDRQVGEELTTQQSESTFFFPADPAYLVIRMALGMNGRIEVYGDGRVMIYRPPHWKNPGTFEASMSSAELTSLLRRLDRLGLMEMTSESLALARREEVERMERLRQSFVTSSDALITVEIHVSSYAHGSLARGPIDEEIAWSSIGGSPGDFSSSDEIQRFSNIIKTLTEELLRERDAQRVDDGAMK